MANENNKETVRQSHCRDITGLIIDVYIVLNGAKNLIMRMITTEIGIILIIRGHSLSQVKLEGEGQIMPQMR